MSSGVYLEMNGEVELFLMRYLRRDEFSSVIWE